MKKEYLLVSLLLTNLAQAMEGAKKKQNNNKRKLKSYVASGKHKIPGASYYKGPGKKNNRVIFYSPDGVEVATLSGITDHRELCEYLDPEAGLPRPTSYSIDVKKQRITYFINSSKIALFKLKNGKVKVGKHLIALKDLKKSDKFPLDLNRINDTDS